ncbi:MAG TPA: hypothetical protein VGQ41_06585 [Pyrinomonadaceae bacterium]|jgi:hypothetical protein|nr:hypothetical protein [Pyrinomonadaceae bacterium]
MSDYIAELQAVFLKLHGCEATYVETVPVIEEFQGKTVWEGDVEVFDIRGHPKATRGYGWGYTTTDGGGRRYFTVLELPPVDSPQAAVKIAIASEIKNAREKKKGR